MDKLHTDKLIVVEGKYDKIRLENIIDAPVIAVGGFRVYNDKKLHRTLRELSKNGVIIIDDSEKITVSDLYALGYTGTDGARRRKSALLSYLGVQEGISNRFLLRILNGRFTRKELADLKLEDK